MGSLDKVLRLTPRTPTASTVHERVGPGPLWKHKDLQLPAYIQHVANDLREKGHDESKAIAMAVGIVRDWAAGRMPNGKGHVHPDVRAAARKAMTEWEAVKSKAHAETAKSHEHAGKHVRATVALSTTGPGAPSWPGQKEIPLPPVPNARTARSMYTAHRVDNMLSYLSHAAERMTAAKQGKAMRGYYMIHANNNLGHALNAGHRLVASVKRNYPAENRELTDLNKTMSLTVAVSKDAKAATFAHLLQTVLYHLAHAKRHAALMLEPDPANEWKFNYDHAAAHTKGALEHCYKLARHIEDNYPEEAKWLSDLAKSQDPHDPFTGLTATGTVLALAQPAYTAPGAKPIPAGQQKPGLYQRPSQTVSPSPPLPPAVTLPTADEVRKLIPQVPECSDPSLSQSARNHLDAAAVKLSKNDSLAALHVLRSVQSDVYACHKTDLGALGPAAYTANVFARTVPDAERSSANTEMLRSKDQEMKWRKLEQQVAVAVDRIRRHHFHGMYGGSPLARFSAESAVGKVLRLTKE